MSRRHSLLDITPMEEVFIEHYIKTGSATASFLVAYSAEKGDLFVGKQAQKVLARPGVQVEIRARMQAAAMESHEVIFRLSQIANTSFADFISIDDEGEMSIDMKKAEQANALGSIKTLKFTKYGPQIELYDRLKALDMLGKYHALWVTVVRNEDWRTLIINDIRAGRLKYGDLVDAFDDTELVIGLFDEANIQIPEVITIPERATQESGDEAIG